MKHKSVLGNVCFWSCSFFIYSLVGWIYEVLLTYHVFGVFENRGFLHGIYLPIYGFSGLLLTLILNITIKKTIHIKKIPVTPIIIFLIVFVVTSIIEYGASYILEKCFNLMLWNYYDYKYNLNGRISLNTSIYFGIGGLLLYYIINPIMNKFREYVNTKIIIILGISVIVVMLIDLIITLLF